MGAVQAGKINLKIVLFSHPGFLRSQSMPRFTQMLREAYERRGHSVEIWKPEPRMFSLAAGTRMAKWAGYWDQYVLFPREVRRALRVSDPGVLYVFCDQALGPWVPLVRHLPHVIHVHDLLALRSALGEFPENPTSMTGKIYQRFIRRGFRRGRHFISVSRKTREDLHRLGGVAPLTSEVIYNGLNHRFSRMPFAQAAEVLQAAKLPSFTEGLLLHVGGAQWYKNLPGVIAMYAHYAAGHQKPSSLCCVSPEPNGAVRAALAAVPAQGRVVFVKNVGTPILEALYSTARALLFPSLEEGFGWPLIEAAACGCPVITTDRPPMNEIAGEQAIYLPRLRFGADLQAWAKAAAAALEGLLSEPDGDRHQRAQRGIDWAGRFDPEATIDRYLAIYQAVIGTESAGPLSPTPSVSR